MTRNVLFGGLLVLATAAAQAAEDSPAARIRAALENALPELRPDAIEPTPVADLYAVRVGAHVLYVSGDGRYLIRGGELLDVEQRENLTENSRREVRRQVLGELEPDALIIFSPKQTRHTVTVFTDIDCPYCVRLHAQMDGYNALGIEVRYAAFPRAGIPSDSYDTTVSVWCSDDPRAAIGDAKAGREVEERTCDNPVEAQFDAARRMGIRGTPAFVLTDGSVVPGYVPPERLAALLDERR